MHQLLVKLSIAGLCAVLFSTLSVAANDRYGIPASDKQRSVLLENLALAVTEIEGRAAEDALWQFWFAQSPDSAIRASLDAAIERREAYDFEAAEQHLDSIVESASTYAEGFNQRAFIRFLRQNYSAAEADLEVALKLEPAHFGAMAGMYQVLMIQNRPKAALRMLRNAVEIHPWLKERTALPKEMWPKNYRDLHDPGQEI